MAERDPEVIEVPDNNGDDWQDVGPINVKEAVVYKEKVDEVFKTMSLMVVDGHKDVVCTTITNFKKLAAKHWKVMQDADVEVVVRSICNSAGVYLHQVLTEGGIDIDKTSTRGTTTMRIPSITIREAQMRRGKAANNISPGSHIRSTCTHQHDVHTISSLAKISDKETVDLVLWAMGRPLMQLNVPEHFVNPTMDERPKTTEQEQKEKLEKFILPQSDHPEVEQAPRFGPTHLLAAAIWLCFKKKFLNEGTSKDACRKFS